MLVPVSSIDDSRLAPYRELNHRNLTRQSGLFIAEGEKVVERLIASAFETASVLAESAYAERFEPRLPTEAPIYVASRRLLQDTIGFHFHRGILACGRRQPVESVEPILASLIRPNPPSLFVPTCRIRQIWAALFARQPHLAVVRLCSAASAPTRFRGAVLRVSMGAALTLPIIESSELAADVKRLPMLISSWLRQLSMHRQSGFLLLSAVNGWSLTWQRRTRPGAEMAGSLIAASRFRCSLALIRLMWRLRRRCCSFTFAASSSREQSCTVRAGGVSLPVRHDRQAHACRSPVLRDQVWSRLSVNCFQPSRAVAEGGGAGADAVEHGEEQVVERVRLRG